MRTPESFEKADIKKYLTGIGAWHFSPMMNGFGKSGVPDIVACISGVMFGIEVKREGKEPTPLQNVRMSDIRCAGGMTSWGTAFKVVNEIERWRVQQGLSPYSTVAVEPSPVSTAAGRKSRSGTERRSLSR